MNGMSIMLQGVQFVLRYILGILDSWNFQWITLGILAMNNYRKERERGGF